MPPTFVNCAPSDAIVPEEKFRVTFSQGSIEHWLAGGTLTSIYQSLSTSPWAYPVSEPPIDDSPVFVVDLRVRQGTVGASPPGSVADMANQLADLSFYNAYEVPRIERLSTTAPILEQKSVVETQAVKDQQASGVTGFFGAAGQNAVKALAVIVLVKSAKTAAA